MNNTSDKETIKTRLTQEDDWTVVEVWKSGWNRLSRHRSPAHAEQIIALLNQGADKSAIELRIHHQHQESPSEYVASRYFFRYT